VNLPLKSGSPRIDQLCSPPLVEPPPIRKSFRINTCKSVSKQSTLTPFRINTYEKRGRGDPHSVPVATPCSTVSLGSIFVFSLHQQPSLEP